MNIEDHMPQLQVPTSKEFENDCNDNIITTNTCLLTKQWQIPLKFCDCKFC